MDVLVDAHCRERRVCLDPVADPEGAMSNRQKLEAETQRLEAMGIIQRGESRERNPRPEISLLGAASPTPEGRTEKSARIGSKSAAGLQGQAKNVTGVTK